MSTIFCFVCLLFLAKGDSHSWPKAITYALKIAIYSPISDLIRLILRNGIVTELFLILTEMLVHNLW